MNYYYLLISDANKMCEQGRINLICHIILFKIHATFSFIIFILHHMVRASGTIENTSSDWKLLATHAKWPGDQIFRLATLSLSINYYQVIKVSSMKQCFCPPDVRTVRASRCGASTGQLCLGQASRRPRAR